ncbi:MAG TPA: hypothetical protein VIN07_08840 [Flavipsychrobacter sp.]
MDIEQMKQMWNKLDAGIDRQQSINAELVKQLVKDRNNRSLSNISWMEYLGIAVAVIVMMVFAVMLPKLGTTPLLVISYIICMLIMVITLVTGIYKLRHISPDDYSNRTVVDMGERIEKLRLFIAKEKVAALASGPVMIAAFIAVVYKFVHNINIFNNITAYMPRIIAGTIAYIILAALLYKQVYFRNINEIKNNLEEIGHMKK